MQKQKDTPRDRNSKTINGKQNSPSIILKYSFVDTNNIHPILLTPIISINIIFLRNLYVENFSVWMSRYCVSQTNGAKDPPDRSFVSVPSDAPGFIAMCVGDSADPRGHISTISVYTARVDEVGESATADG